MRGPTKADSRTKKPRKQSPDFSLCYHNGSGQYCKKVAGKRFYFGVDPDAALARWKAEETPIRNNEPIKPAGDAFAAMEACNHFLTNAKAKRNGGELSNRSFDDYRTTCERMH
jgi:hypothetical protein